MPVRKLAHQYVIEFEQRGSRVFRRLPPGATKAQAQELELKLRQELIDQTILGKRPNVPLEYAINEWLREVVTGRKAEKATRSKAGIVGNLCTGLAITQAQEAARVVREAAPANGERKAGLAPATINRRLCILKAVATFAWRKGWTQENLSGKIQMVPGEKARTRKIPERQIAALIERGRDAETRAFIALGGYGLMRQGEVMALGHEDVTRNAITIPDSKTSKPRVVPVVAQLRPHLAAIPMTSHVRTLYARFEEARDAVPIEDLIYHDLRRSGATILLNRGVDIATVAHILGISLQTAAKHYALVLDKTSARAMKQGFPIRNPSNIVERGTKKR